MSVRLGISVRVPRQAFLPVHLLGLDALLGSVGPVAGDVKLQDDGVVHDPVNRRPAAGHRLARRPAAGDGHFRRSPGSAGSPTRVHHRQWMQRWLEVVVKPGYSPSTLTGYCSTVRCYITPVLGDVLLISLTFQQVDSMESQLLSDGFSQAIANHIN